MRGLAGMQQQALRIWVIAYVLHLFLVIVADGQGIDLPVSDPNELLTHMVVPGRITVCFESYPPFVLPQGWQGETLSVLESSDSLSPAQTRDLFVPDGFRLPNGTVIAQGNLTATGYDIEILLLLSKVLTMPIAFKFYPNYLEFYYALRNRECDMAATGAEQDAARAHCMRNCPVPPIEINSELDYGDPSWRDQYSSVCCLEYSISYVQSGFAIVAHAKSSEQSAVSAVFTVDMLNNLAGVLLIAVGMGWILWCIEHRSNPRWTPGNSVYFAIVTLTTVGYGDLCPYTGLGKFLSSVWMMSSVICLCVVTSFVTAKLTVDSFASGGVESLDDINGQLCIESEYMIVQKFANDSRFNWQQVVLARPDECFAGVLTGQYQAYMTDKITLNWMIWSSVNDTSALSVSPALNSNPLSFVFNAGSRLKQLVDFGIIEMRSNPQYGLKAAAIYQDYFQGSLNAHFVRVVPGTPINVPVVVASSVFIFFTLIICGLESWLNTHPKLWRYLPPYLVKCLAWEAVEAHDMSAKSSPDGIVKPDRELDEVRKELALLAATAEDNAAKFRMLTTRLGYVASTTVAAGGAGPPIAGRRPRGLTGSGD